MLKHFLKKLKDFTGSLVHIKKNTAVGKAGIILILIYVSLMSLLILFCVNKSLHLCTHQNNWTGTLKPFSSTGALPPEFSSLLFEGQCMLKCRVQPVHLDKPIILPMTKKHSTVVKTHFCYYVSASFNKCFRQMY